MTNQMFNPQPNYSGVTIQIANPAVNVTPNGFPNGAACPQSCCYPTNPIYQTNQGQTIPNVGQMIPNGSQSVQTGRIPQLEGRQTNSQNGTGYGQNVQTTDSGYPYAYPSEYYLNNYGNPANSVQNPQNPQNSVQINNPPQTENPQTLGYQPVNEIREGNGANRVNGEDFAKGGFIAGENLEIPPQEDNVPTHRVDPEAGISQYKDYADTPKVKEPEDMTASKNIIGSLDERNAEIKEEKKKTKEQKIVALTDEYIMSLENYLNNPNDELRLMAAKEILTRLDEDKNRYDDAALNALLNKMLQDPSKLIRLAALSAFASQLASGNEYTVQLLQNIQANPNADKEDALQAADILLKMSSGVEVRNVPVSDVKREQYKMKPRKSA